MPEENLYELLQVEPTADSRSIRAAYRRLMLLHHPDRNAGVDAQEMAQRLNRAYEILRNPGRRAAYDWEWDISAVQCQMSHSQYFVVETDEYAKLHELFMPFQGISTAEFTPVRDLMAL